MYAKYIKDILGNKKTLPTIEVVQLTEECSATILDPLPEKKDLGCPTITCSIEAQHFKHALCDLGASVSIMPKLVYDKLNHHALAPTLNSFFLSFIRPLGMWCSLNWFLNSYQVMVLGASWAAM
jgi:hypothetical protein